MRIIIAGFCLSLRTWAAAAKTWGKGQHIWLEPEKAWESLRPARAAYDYALSQVTHYNMESILASYAPAIVSLPNLAQESVSAPLKSAWLGDLRSLLNMTWMKTSWNFRY
jgi:hypothetical protein